MLCNGNGDKEAPGEESPCSLPAAQEMADGAHTGTHTAGGSWVGGGDTSPWFQAAWLAKTSALEAFEPA